jgi:ERCC4-related helicase
LLFFFFFSDNREAIQNVIYNLLISNLEARTEDDDDVKEYLHTKSVEVVKVPLSTELKQTRELFLRVASIVINELVNANVFYTRNVAAVHSHLID